MAKSKSESQKGTYTLEENLALTNEELTSNWAKLASLIRQAENIKWEKARAKSIRLLENPKKAFEYIDSIRHKNSVEPESIVEDHYDKSDNTEKSEKAKTSESKTEKQKSGKVVQMKPKPRMDIFSNNYKRIVRLAPNIETRLLDGEEIYGKSESVGSMDFNIELLFKHGDDYHLALSQYFKQNGDLVPDPDMEIRFNIKQQIVEALHFQNQFGQIDVYDDKIKRKMVRQDQKKGQNKFLETWLLELLADERTIEWKHEPEQEPPKAKPRRSKGESVSESNTDPKQVETTVSDIDKIEVEQTVKYWAKLAAVIRENETGITPEEAKKKALKLKEEEKAEEYVIRAFVNQRKNGLDKQLKRNYDALLFCLPDIHKKMKDETAHAFIALSKDKGYKLENAASINNSTEQYALYDDGTGTLLFAVQKVRKRAWVTVMTGNFFGNSIEEDYMNETYDRSSPEHYEINLQFEKWLNKTAERKKDVIWGKTISAIEKQTEKIDVERTLEKLRSKYPIVLEWTEGAGDDLRGFKSIETLQKALLENGFTSNPTETYIKNKIWFKGYPSYLRIDVSKSEGDYDPESEDLAHWLEHSYDKSFDWSQFRKEKITKGKTDLHKGKKQKLKVGNEVKYKKSKDTATYTVTELLGWNDYKGSFYVTIDNDSLKIGRVESEEKLTPVKRSKESQPKPKEDNDSEIVFEFDIKKAKEDAKSIPDFEPGKVELVEAHKRAGITQKDINWINKHQQGLTITPRRNPINNTKSLERDLEKGAQRPGKRISRTGKIYYEGRSNRSDLTKHGL